MTDYEHNTFPPSWKVGHLHLVPREITDPRDTSLDSPARIAERERSAANLDVEALKRLRDIPTFKGDADDAIWEDYLVLPIIHVRVLTADREKTANDLRKDLVIHVGGLHVEGFDPLYVVSPALDVV